MLFFINPLSNIVQKLANEQERAKLLSNEREFSRLLGLRPVTNSVNEFELYYQKFLGFLIHHLEAAIAEIETDETVEEKQPAVQQPEVQQPAIPAIEGYTPEEVDAYESIFGEYPPSPAPAVEDVIEPVTPTATVKTEPTQEIDEELETETIKERLLEAKNKKELDAIKAENPDAVTAIWDELTIPEKNHIKCIAQSIDGRKRPITPGYRFIYTAPNGSEQYVRYIGFYLHGEAITNEDKRAILLDGIGIICSKKDLKPSKKQVNLKDSEKELLQDIMSNPVETKPTETVATETPTASEMAENNFTGLVAPKKSQDGLTSGKTENSQPSKQNAVQKMLDLKTPSIEPETTTEAKPTDWLLAIEREIQQANTELTFEYDSFGGSIYLEVFHGETRVITLEDNGSSIEIRGADKLKFHGISDEKLDIMLHPDFLQSPKA